MGFTSYGTKGEKGTGLGINLCMDYIERHGGSLSISSEIGKGSKFTFSVPASRAKACVSEKIREAFSFS